MKRKFLLLVLFLCLFIYPVTSWDLLSEYNLANTGGAPLQHVKYYTPVTYQTWNANQTRMLFTGNCTNQYGTYATSGTKSVNLKQSGVIKGNATFSWNCNNPGLICEMDLRITDSALTATAPIYLYEGATDIMSSTKLYMACKESNQAANIPSYNTFSLYQPDVGYYAVGNYKTYGGSEIPPTTNKTLIVTVKNLANQAISNVPTAIFINDGSYSAAQYTNASGMVQYDNVPVPDGNTSTEFSTSATGIYNAYNEDFNFDSSPLSKTVYLQPVSPSGTYANFTYNVVNIGGDAIPSAYIDHKISANYELIDLTDANGQKTFYNVPVVNNAWFYTAYKSGYIDYSRWSSFTAPFPSDVTINITLQGGGITPTPTPIGYTPTPTPIITPPVGLEWTLTANPNSILLGDSSMLWLSAPNSQEQAKAKTILYYENNNLGVYSTYVLKGTYKYNTTTSQWDFKNPTTNQWTYGGQDSSVLTVYPATTGSYTYKATIFDNGTFPYTTGNVIGTATTNLVIGGGAGGNENLVCLIAATDGSTSSHLSDWGLSITDTLTGASNSWDNVTYDKMVSLVRGRDYSITGSKYGYVTNTRTITPPLDQNVQTGDIGAMFNIPLFKSSDISAGNTSVIVAVLDKETYVPVPNAKVSITGQTWKYTGTDGESVSFILPQNTDYTASTEKDGYCGSSTFGNTGTDDYQNVFLYLKYGACLNPTPTHTPIPNSTSAITPTITPVHMGNMSAPTTCNRNITLFNPNYTLMEQGLNQVACAGFQDLEQQRLVLAILAILLFGGVFGYIAGGTGILAGIGIGVVIDTAAGLLDAWIFFAFLIIASVLISMKLFGGGTGA